MKLATEKTASPDGTLLVVSRDLTRVVEAAGIADTLHEVLDRWEETEVLLQALYQRLNDAALPGSRPYDSVEFAAPLPRAWQWLDGSAFPVHGDLMSRAFNKPPIDTDMPLMYQGMSHRFLGPCEPAIFSAEDDAIDFEGEFGVITATVPMGADRDAAAQSIRLAVQINDWSLRCYAVPEMKTGFGAVPATEMELGFNDLISHAARTRDLCAGTIIGSGTVSHSRYREVGSCCIAERQAIEIIEQGEAKTGYLRFGERVRMQATDGDSTRPLFGVMDQQVISA